MYSANVFISNNERVVIILTCFSMVTLYAIGKIISHSYLFSYGSNCVSRIEEENNLSPSSLKTFSLAMFLLHKSPHLLNTIIRYCLQCKNCFWFLPQVI